MLSEKTVPGLKALLDCFAGMGTPELCVSIKSRPDSSDRCAWAKAATCDEIVIEAVNRLVA